jgi:hypothetical protein
MGSQGWTSHEPPHMDAENHMCWNDHNSYSEPLMSSVAFNTVIERYLDYLRTEGVDEPLTASFTLAAVLDDLCRLAEVRPAAGTG